MLLHVYTRGDQHKMQEENWLVTSLKDTQKAPPPRL